MTSPSAGAAPSIHLATQPGRGGVCVLLLTGSPEQMQRVDSFLHPHSCLQPGDLAHGWLVDPPTQTRLDEVLLAAPHEGQRILTGHGGTASALALLDFFARQGFRESPDCPLLPTGLPGVKASPFAAPDALAARLPDCRTEAQAAMVLQALAGDKAARAGVPEMLRPRRWCLCGAPNTGKSSLLNRLSDQQRVLVSDQAGTTLDAVSHRLDIGGYDCTLVDTAGFRQQAGTTEQEAMRRASAEIRQADLTTCLLDTSRPFSEDDTLALAQASQARQLLLLLSKSDCMLPDWHTPESPLRRRLHERFPDTPLLILHTRPVLNTDADDGIPQLLQAVIARLAAAPVNSVPDAGNIC